jgi:hypothetical protein
MQGLIGIQGIWAAMAHITKRTPSGAFVAHDHERGGAIAKALANVGTRGFFANGHKLIAPQDVLDLIKPRVR